MISVNGYWMMGLFMVEDEMELQPSKTVDGA